METQRSHVFLSHSSVDKPTVRRIARRLRHRGISIWLDENELRLGDRLPRLIRNQIEAAPYFVVYASNNAEASRWVRLETEAASNAGTTVIPLFPRDTNPWGALVDQMGMVLEPHEFERAMDQLAAGILGALDDDSDVSARDEAILRADLDSLRGEHPEVVRSVLDAIAGAWLIDAVDPSDRDPIETLMWIEWELSDPARRDDIAFTAATLYRLRGLGYELLDRHLRESRDHTRVLTELCRELSAPELIRPAFRLLELGPPSALFMRWLVMGNIDAMMEAEVDDVVRFTVRPAEDYEYSDERLFLADYLFKHRPADERLNSFWVERAYAATGSSHVLIRLLADADSQGLDSYLPAIRALRSRVRNFARSADLLVRTGALHLVITAYIEHYPRCDELYDEAVIASGSAEWKDPDTPLQFREAYRSVLHSIDDDLQEAAEQYVALTSQLA